MPFSVQEILDCTESSEGRGRGRVVNSSSLGARIEDISVDQPASLKSAKSSDLAFFFSRAFEHELPSANPGILVIGEAFAKPLQDAGLPFWKTAAVIAYQDPYFAMAVISEKFAAILSAGAHLSREAKSTAAEIHPTAVVHATAEIAEGVKIGPYCIIEAHSKIGSGCTLYPGCFVGAHTTLGPNCVLFPRVVIYDGTRVGARVRFHSGAVVGADGFGYAPVIKDKKVVGHQKIYHLGRVTIGDDVEIGANSTVDRATIDETRIEKNAKLDNLVHVGHNASVDEGAILCGGTCLAGNASVGKYAYVGGMTGVSNHVHVGDGASVAAHTLVTKDVPAGGTAVGNPQREYKEHFRAHALLSRLLAERRKK